MRLFVTVLLSLLALPGTAAAATVRSEPSPSRYYAPKMTFEAAPGEVNRVVLSGGPTARRVIDESAPLVAGDGCRQVTEHEAVCGNSYDISINLGDGDDRASLEATAASGAYVQAGPGDDVLMGGPGSESFNGGDGRDTISGGAGNDSVEGDAETPFADRLDGGPGNDGLDYRTHRTGVRVDLSDPSVSAGAEGEGDQQSGFERVYAGTGGPSELIGDDGPNFLVARAPGSRVVGGDGTDHVEATRDSTVDGGGGDDRVVGTPGGRAVCGTGTDLVYAGDDGYRRYGWYVSSFGLVARDCERLPVGFSDIDDVEIRPQPKLRGTRASLRIPCPRLAESKLGCVGHVILRDTRGRLLGRRDYRTAEGRTATVGVTLGKKTVRRIKRPGGLEVRVFVRINASRAERGDAGWSVTLGG